MQLTALPTTVTGVDAPWVETALRTRFPNLEVRDMRVREVQFSTATRILVDLDFGPAGLGVPAQLCVKGGFDCDQYDKRAVTFRREARAYGELLPMVSVRRPACYFAALDEVNGQGVTITEDVVAAGGTANRALEAPDVAAAAEYLDTLAMLHASTWDAPWLDRVPWLTVTLAEDDTLRHWWDVPELEHYLHEEGRAEVVDPALQDPVRLLAMFHSLAPIAARRPRSVLHGDTHIGNSYRTAAGEAAFLDWQGVTQGPWARDVSYFMASNLTVEDRRAHERDLLAYYLGRLAHNGAAPPGLDEAWIEYRRWLIVPLLVWIRNSDRCQSREANRLGAYRSSTAVMDLETLDLYQ
jgi:hypothetical protein